MKRESDVLLAIDDGGFECKIAVNNQLYSFPSAKGLMTTEPNLMTTSGENDFIVEFENRKFVCGEVAIHDCPLKMEINTVGKSHIFFDLSVYLAVFKYGAVNNKIIVSLPVRSYSTKEIESRKSRLLGHKTITVNDVTKSFFIEEVAVAPEAPSAFFINKDEGKSHYIDIGSRTINYSTVLCENGKHRFIDSESDTFYGYGVTALGDNYHPYGLAQFIGGRLIKVFDNKNKIYVMGGGALNKELIHHLREFFPDLIVMESPSFSNVKGMYELGKGAFGID